METRITEYSQTAAALAVLRERYEGARFPVETPAGMKEAKAARGELRKYRTDLERMRKELKEPALERCKLIDSEAKKITEELRALEDPIAAQIQAEDDRIEAERQEKIRIEEARVEAIQARIADIRHAIEPLAWDTSARDIAIVIGQIEKIAIDESFAEFIDQARDARDATLARLRDMHAKAEAREVEERRLNAERVELERLRAAENRRRAIREKIDEIRGAVDAVTYFGDPASEKVAEFIRDVEQIEIDPSFEEFTEEAHAVKASTLAKLRELHAAAVDREQEEARRRAELEAQEQRLAAERQRQEVRDQISIIRALPAQCPGLAAAEIERVLTRAEAFTIPEIDDAELRAEAEAAKADSIAAIRSALAGRKRYEAEQAERERAEREEAERRRKAEEAARKARYPGDKALVDALVERFEITAEVADKWLRRYGKKARAA